MKLELSKDLFKESWSRRDQLTGSVGTPITVLTGLGGAIALLVANFEGSSSCRTYLFAGAVALAIGGLVAATYFVVRSYHGYVYQEIPNAVDLDQHCTALHEYHRGAGNPPAIADTEFDEYLSARFVEAADVNSRNNVSKAAFLYRASQSLIFAIICTAAATVPWAIGQIGRSPKSQRVTIDTPIRLQSPTGDIRAILLDPASGTVKADTSASTNTSSTAAGAAEPSDTRRRAASPPPSTTTAKQSATKPIDQ